MARVCLTCGKEVREGAYSGAAGNFRKHVEACEKKHELRPCQACGKPVAMRFKVNREHGGGKARVAHRCPHGQVCPAGHPLNGVHCNAPTPTSLGGCRECNVREVEARS